MFLLQSLNECDANDDYLGTSSCVILFIHPKLAW